MAVEGKKWAIIFGKREKETKKLGVEIEKEDLAGGGGSYDHSEMLRIARIYSLVKKRSKSGSF